MAPDCSQNVERRTRGLMAGKEQIRLHYADIAGRYGPSLTRSDESPNVRGRWRYESSNGSSQASDVAVLLPETRFSEIISIRSDQQASTLKNLLPFFRIICLYPPILPAGGALRIVTGVGRDAVDARMSLDERRMCGRPSRVVLISRR
jgi:hypothetical protein